jgi:hypothetical protein
MSKQKILYICGSLNQTTQMHKIARELPEYDAYFTPYHADGHEVIKIAIRTGILDFTVLGGQAKNKTLSYIKANNLKLDYEGMQNHYDLVFTCADMLIPKNIRDSKIILVQEGMTDPPNFAYNLIKKFNFPRWLGGTATTGLSNQYDIFCVASNGYRNKFISEGIDEKKIEVTGIPNFDACEKYLDNDFPYHGYALVATSDMRETLKYENRKKFIKRAVEIANGRKLIFKLHPNENITRATKEIDNYAPGSLVFHRENIEPMIANCDILVTRFSTVVYIGLALGKEVISDFDVAELRKLLPLQNNGKSAFNIAHIARRLLAEPEKSNVYIMDKNLIPKRNLIQRIRAKRKLAGFKNSI